MVFEYMWAVILQHNRILIRIRIHSPYTVVSISLQVWQASFYTVETGMQK